MGSIEFKMKKDTNISLFLVINETKHKYSEIITRYFVVFLFETYHALTK